MRVAIFGLAFVVLASMTAVAACAASGDPTSPNASAEPRRAMILAQSSPADGATVSGSPEALTLRFSRPARLHEVTVVGADGAAAPMMVTAAGEVEVYSVPLPELEPGRYSVTWRAESAGEPFQGVIRFAVR